MRRKNLNRWERWSPVVLVGLGAPLGVLALGVLVLLPVRAGAQTPPPDVSQTATPAPTDVPQIPTSQKCASGNLGPIHSVFEPDEMKACAQQANQQQVHDQAKSFMDSNLPDESGSSVPMSAYDVGSSSSFAHGTALIWGALMQMFFTASVWITGIGLWILSWAMQFPFATLGSHVADEISRLLLMRIVGPLGLGAFALLLCAVAAVIHLFRGRAGSAIKEVATAMFALVLAPFILANPGALLRSGFRVESQIVETILTLGSSQSTALGINGSAPAGLSGTSSVLGPLKAAVLSADVQKPYDLINWGQPLTGRCAEIRNEALSLGPWGDADAPRDTMAKVPECKKAATFNENPSLARAGSAFLSFLNSIGSLGLLGLLALALLVSEMGAVGLMSVAILAVIAALVPKVRALAWRWVEGLLRVLIVTVVAAFLLAFWSLLMTAILDQMADAQLIMRFAVMTCGTVLCIYAFLQALKRIPHFARNAVGSMEGKEGWLPAKKSHGGALGLGLGMGFAEAQMVQAKFRRLMPSRSSGNSKKISAPAFSLAGEHAAIHAGRKDDDLEIPPWPPTSEMVRTREYGVGGENWQGSRHVKSERVPPNTYDARVQRVMEQASNQLANPLTRPMVKVPSTNSPRKVLMPARRALPVAGTVVIDMPEGGTG